MRRERRDFQGAAGDSVAHAKKGKKMDKFDDAVELFQLGARMSLRYHEKQIVVTYSGGKDSDVLVQVALASGMPFEVHNNHTTVDAPQTVYHIREKFKQLEEQGIKCVIEYGEYKGQRTTMWDLIVQKVMPPTRRVRYCCSVLKERGCEGRVIATGVRWEESTQRKSRKEVETIARTKAESVGFNRKKEEYEQLSFMEDSEIILQNDNDDRRKVIDHCQLKNKIAVNPIIGLTEKDVWEILKWQKVKTNILYEMGYDRVGCIGCPMAGTCQRKKEFEDFPKYKQAYIRAFERMIRERERRGLATKWKSGQEVFEWWMEETQMNGQLYFDEYGEMHEIINN